MNVRIGGSLIGKQMDSKSVDEGSSPSPPANVFSSTCLWLYGMMSLLYEDKKLSGYGAKL